MPRGRKAIFETVEEMEDAIEEYFKYCEGEPLIVDGEVVYKKNGDVAMIHQHPPTITGLCHALGFKARKSLLDYQSKNKAFQKLIQDAKDRVRIYTEERLFDRDGVNGARFVLERFFGEAVQAPEDSTVRVVILPEVEKEEPPDA